MGIEIERKFLVKNGDWAPLAIARQRIRQGYLSSGAEASVRVRIADGQAFLTIKSAAVGLSRQEYEYSIPMADAEALLKVCTGSLISKVRHTVPAGGLSWSLDIFEGENAGLEIAEVEIDREDAPIELPSWVGAEVTGDRRYYNADLCVSPYSTWK
ncbi:MAG: CYTH domain-containing protein [Hyphomicrobiaceae bacterium]|nr:MAG: CYTH domain-containing protein [Hyphomicrobiaceae bacterium]